MYLAKDEQRGRVWSAGSVLLNEAQDVDDLLFCKVTLLTYVQLGIHQDPQGLFLKAVFQLGGYQHILVHGVVPSQVQNFTLPFSKLHKGPVSPLSQPVKVPSW